MVQLFKKIGADISRFGKKVAEGANKAFKKGGVIENTLGKIGSGLAKGAEVAGKVASAGSDILNQVQSSPFGKMIPAPVLGFAQSALKGVSQIGKLASAGSDVSRELTSGKGVKDISKNVIERAVKAKEETGPLFK